MLLESNYLSDPIETGVGYKVYHDPYPVTPLHLVYAVEDSSALSKCFDLAYKQGLSYIEQGLADGFNIGLNHNECAGQLVTGLHIHLIMRQRNDSANAAGGIRRAVEGQGDFTITHYQHPHRGDISSEIVEKFNHLHLDKFYPLFGSGDVPGYLLESDSDAIDTIVSMLPDNCCIVEFGSFLGKSAVEWAKCLSKQNKTGEVVCIDTFNAASKPLATLLKDADFVVPPGDLDQSQMFDYYTKAWPSIKKIQCLFDKNFYWDIPVDCVFEDSDHREETLLISLPFWWARLKENGILCGHDYILPSVKKMVDLFALSNKTSVQLFPDSSVWMMVKSNG